MEWKSGEGEEEDLERIWRDLGENSEGSGRLEVATVSLGDGAGCSGYSMISHFLLR